ncbi:MAG: asparagine synthase (glutamine-hydrolyzing) [Methanoregula sp.]|jgi:asparagine synthase (glutamine-hydrolysing)|uniref:asparagine synthase (glutamine-hydrolyzing) n=1 Tax=Methanoregula sp. TaxID=2052170 RepID=UPI003D0B8D41
MCGIAGYFGPNEISQVNVETCLRLMNRRGPDAASYKKWTDDRGNNAYLLHTRLSIIDLDSRASQPFRVNAKWIAFNGELYNYVERKDELLAAGEEFTTTSDTEVLLRAIDHYGWDVLDRCEGMWAFAVYDEETRSLSLCRDRFGEKPLFLFRDETGFYFGSEVKFITALLGHKLEVNTDHLCRYLINGYRALYKKEDTFFQGLRELPSSTLLSLKPDGTEERKTYWSLDFSPDDTMSYDEAVAGVRERLIRSVKLRLRSDVPLAFCMSGGVDSNSLISIAKKVFRYDVHGFTIMNTDSRYDEKDMVDCVVSELGIRHTPIPLDTGSFLENLRTLVRQHDAPVYTISYYIHWLLMESIASHGYRVSVSGTAGDELFSGYFDHQLMYLREVRNDPRYPSAKAAWEKYIRPIVRNPFLSDPGRFIRDPGFRDHLYLEADNFRQYLKRDWKEPFFEEHYTDDLLRNRMLNELFREVIPVVLHEDDLNAMYFSIENRSPFLDRELAEFCNRIPTKYLLRDGIAKIILRDAMRGIVPDKVVDNRTKIGFNAPIFDLLDVKDPKIRAEVLNESPIYDYIRREKIDLLMNKSYLENHESLFLFYFLCAKFFLEEFGGDRAAGGGA